MQLSDLMQDYFSASTETHDPVLQSGHVTKDWEIVESPERLMKDYSFSTRSQALEFLRQLVLFEDSAGHHAKISLENADIRVEVYTHDINRVTEIDAEYAATADQIYIDATGYGSCG